MGSYFIFSQRISCFLASRLDEFGRRSVLAARQTLISKVMELEKDELYKKYKDRVGDVITGEVY